jgi:S-DNA-T family DNA segregation ATPase FtsK/SpoIIIE
LIVDDLAQFATRTSAVRRFIETCSPSTMAVVDDTDTVPAVCRGVVTIGVTGAVRVDDPGGRADFVSDRLRDRCGASSSAFGTGSNIRGCGMSIERVERVARTLAALVDPELDDSGGASMASSVRLGDIDEVVAGAFGSDAARRSAARSIAGRWTDAGADPAPRVPIGRSADGTVEIDLVRDGPHALIAGTTGSGKSELLRSLVVALALRLSPQHLTFVLVDYKGGSTFDACAELPHTVGVVTDLDAGLAERALVSLDAELHRRERLLRDVGASDLSDYRRHPQAQTLPRLVVVIDEFAALAKELPDFLAALIGVAQRGRSLGLHLVLATQRPAGVVSDDIRANTNLRIALRLNDTADAHDVVGDHRPTTFARGLPGRCALRLGPEELVVFQAAHCTGPARRRAARLEVRDASDGDREKAGSVDARPAGERRELEVAAALVADAAELVDIDPPHRPWTEPLPTQATASDVDVIAGGHPHDAIGVIDDPATQSRLPLRWHRAVGNLALVGSLGSGTTSALVSLITARCRIAAPSDEHWYVIDARGDTALDGLASLAHCGGLIRVRERERLHRVLARLDADIDVRAGVDCLLPAVSLAVDGLSSLRTALGSIEDTPTLALLDRVLADGPAAGIATCWTDDGPTTMLAASPAETWIFHLDDDAAARSMGVTPVPPDVPGRMRIRSTNREAQVALGADGVAALPDRSVDDGPPAVDVLPSCVRAEHLGRSPRERRAGSGLTVGLACDDLSPVAISVPPGDHILIGGASLTGKSTALRQLVAEWRRMHPRGTVIEVDRRRPPGDALATGLPEELLVVIDDADRVEDPDGRLASIIAGRHARVLIIAAARLDAVRSNYGHWTRDIARSHCGLILTSPGDVDGDLLGATLPRRSLIPARPGLAWLVDGTGHRLVQVAQCDE